MTRAALVLALLLIGCELPGHPADPAEVHEVMLEWHAAGFPLRGLCHDQGSDVRVYETGSTQELHDVCGFDPSTYPILACLDYDGVLDNQTPVIVVAPGHDDRPTRVHELLHWLSECSGAITQADDVQHRTPKIWGRGGLMERLK